jgi:hypothetical protein
MHFATPRQLAAMALAWAALLVGYDQHANPRPLATYWAEFMGGSTRPTVLSENGAPRLKLSLSHFCCTDCVGDIRAALKPFVWLGPARVAVESPAAEAATADGSRAREIEFDLVDPEKADFIALDRALRDVGLVAEKVEISGIGHYRLEVSLPHLCSSAGAESLDQPLERLLKKETQGRWLDSLSVNHDQKTVLVYARMNAVVDVVELATALGHAGFSPQAIRILTGPEQ